MHDAMFTMSLLPCISLNCAWSLVHTEVPLQELSCFDAVMYAVMQVRLLVTSCIAAEHGTIPEKALG